MRFGSPTKPSSWSRFPALARLLQRGSCSVAQQRHHNQLAQLKNGLSAARQVVWIISWWYLNSDGQADFLAGARRLAHGPTPSSPRPRRRARLTIVGAIVYGDSV